MTNITIDNKIFKNRLKISIIHSHSSADNSTQMSVIMNTIESIFDEYLQFDPKKFKFIFPIVFTKCFNELIIKQIAYNLAKLKIPIKYNDDCRTKITNMLIERRFDILDYLYELDFIPDGDVLYPLFTNDASVGDDNNAYLPIINWYWDKCNTDKFLYMFLITSLKSRSSDNQSIDGTASNNQSIDGTAGSNIRFLIETKKIFEKNIPYKYQQRSLVNLLIEHADYIEYFIEHGYKIIDDVEFLIINAIDNNNINYLKKILPHITQGNPITLKQQYLCAMINKKMFEIITLLITYNLLSHSNKCALISKSIDQQYVELLPILLNSITNISPYTKEMWLKKTYKVNNKNLMNINRVIKNIASTPIIRRRIYRV